MCPAQATTIGVDTPGNGIDWPETCRRPTSLSSADATVQVARALQTPAIWNVCFESDEHKVVASFGARVRACRGVFGDMS